MSPFRIFIFCDDPSHAPKRVPVDVFLALPDGGWHEQPPKFRSGRSGHVGLGMHMVGDSPAQTEWALDPSHANDQVRTRFEIYCDRTPECRRRRAPSRQEHLFAILDKLRELGIDEQPLSVLAAMMGEQAKRSRPPS